MKKNLPGKTCFSRIETDPSLGLKASANSRSESQKKFPASVIAFGLHIALRGLLAFGWPIAAAQGTLTLGFEDYAIGQTPPFVRPDAPGEPTPRVADGSAGVTAKPYEGRQYLLASGAILLGAPTAQPISEFSFRVFVPPPPLGSRLDFRVANQPVTLPPLGSWELVQGTLDPPANALRISSFYDNGEVFAFGFGVDAVQLVTVPEPTTAALILCGAAVLLAPGSRWKKRRCGERDRR